MHGTLAVRRRVAQQRVTPDLEGIVRRQARRERMEIHHASDGVASIQDGPRAEDDLSIFDHVWIDGDDILQITTSEDGIIHSDTISHDEHAVGCEPPDHRASTRLLAFLDENTC